MLPLHIRYDRNPSSFVPSVMEKSRVTYYGRGGVIEIFENGDVHWDGLRHATLSIDDNHIYQSDWKQAAIPVICHGGRGIDDALVIGLGTGITAVTLGRCDGVKSVDVYEINHTLEAVLRFPRWHAQRGRRPQGPHHLAGWPRRRGAARQAVRPDHADAAIPQAGRQQHPALREHMQLVKKRLKKNGVYCVYSNSFGEDRQARLVRKTVASVFPHTESFCDGYLIVASNDPFTYDPDALLLVPKLDRLMNEVYQVGTHKIKLDDPRLEWANCPYVITDDHPLVEYPRVICALLP